jgi:hypothetical protein
MVASDAKVRVLRGREGGSPWQIVCADCGPLETVADEQGGMKIGRAHLVRAHDGGGLAMDVGPYRAVGPRHDGVPEAEAEPDATATLEAVAAWLERQGPLPAGAGGLERLGRALLASRGELESGAPLEGALLASRGELESGGPLEGEASAPVDVAAAPLAWSGWRKRA